MFNFTKIDLSLSLKNIFYCLICLFFDHFIQIQMRNTQTFRKQSGNYGLSGAHIPQQHYFLYTHKPLYSNMLKLFSMKTQIYAKNTLKHQYKPPIFAPAI